LGKTEGDHDTSKLKIIAKDNGIGYRTLKTRIGRGWDEQRACTTPIMNAQGLREHMKRARDCHRKIPPDWVEIAKNNGISHHCLWRRITNGWDYTRATTTLPSPYNGMKRVKELYGDDYFRRLRKWLFVKVNK
jgi:hypothetical protein